MDYSLKRLTSAQASSLAGPISKISDAAEKVDGKISLHAKPRKDSFLVMRFEQGEIITGSGGNRKTRSIFTLFLSACASAESCRKEKELADGKTANLGNWAALPQGVQISALYFVDANKDGFNDVLIKLSNGTALLYESQIPRGIAF